MVEIATGRGLDAVQGEAVPLPFADGAFERLLTSHFYGHLLPGEEAQRFLAEARRVAGELVVVDAASRPDIDDDRWEERRLNDGSTPRGLQAALPRKRAGRGARRRRGPARRRLVRRRQGRPCSSAPLTLASSAFRR